MPQNPTLSSQQNAADKQSRESGPVVRAIGVLKCISEGSYTLADISKNCSMSKSTTHGLLQKLIRANAVIQDPATHNYYPSQLITRMSSNYTAIHQYLYACSMEEMKYLANATHERITLSLLVGFKVFRLNSIHGQHALRVVDDDLELNLSETFSAAPGKVLFSQLSYDTLRKMAHLIKPDSLPNAAFDEVMADVKKIQQQRYFVTIGARHEGVTCISVPISNYSVPVALNVIGPETRLEPKIKDYVAMALKSAEHIARNLASEPL
jgi:DNA-binding IclR family transcriptional regulator